MSFSANRLLLLKNRSTRVGYSANAQAVIDLMSGLTTPQKNAIAAFVDSQVDLGNWASLDVLQVYALGAVNGLIDWKGVYNATNPSGYSFVTGGVDIPGSGAGLVTNYNTITGVKWAERDAVEGAYVYRNDSATDQKILIGGSVSAYWVQRTVASRLDFNMNAIIRQITTYANGWEKGLWSAKLEASGANEIIRAYKDASDLGVGAVNTAVERNDTVRIGGRESAISALDGVVSLYYAGAGDTFNVPGFSSNLDILLSSLGL